MSNNSMQKYSVLFSLYKKEKPEYLRESIQSMVNQTVAPDEILIVKDGFITPELQIVLDDFNAAYPDLFTIVGYDQNRGLGYALAWGMQRVRNELVARMDTDDISLPERCEKQLALFELNPELDIVGCPVKEFCGSIDNVTGVRNVPIAYSEILKYGKRRDPFNHPTVMFRKSKVLAAGNYSDYPKNQDTDLWVKMLGMGCLAVNIPEYLLLFRFDEGTYKKRKTWRNTKSLIEIRWRAYKIHYCSFFDFFIVFCAQMLIYIMPLFVQKFIYQIFLRKQ